MVQLLTINDLDEIESVPAETIKLAEKWRDALTCFCWLPQESTAILSRQHTGLSLNTQGDLHCETGPAWEWADGTVIHSLSGIRVPDWVVDAETVDPERLLRLGNLEQRRVAFELYGWDRAAADLNWELIDDSGDAYTGRLYRVPVGMLRSPESGEDCDILVGENASPHPDGQHKRYGMPVTSGFKRAEEAQASLMGMTVDQWKAIGLRT